MPVGSHGPGGFRRKLGWLLAVVIALVLLLAAAGIRRLLAPLHTGRANGAARRTGEDSARAETERLRRELDIARAAAAPVAQVESLRAQLASAESRTTELRAAWSAARPPSRAARRRGSGRVAAQEEVQRLRDELAAAERRAPSAATLDSLRHASPPRSTRPRPRRQVAGHPPRPISRPRPAEPGAVGLVTVSFGGHTTAAPASRSPRRVHAHQLARRGRFAARAARHHLVTMADQTQARYADVIATSQDRESP